MEMEWQRAWRASPGQILVRNAPQCLSGSAAPGLTFGEVTDMSIVYCFFTHSVDAFTRAQSVTNAFGGRAQPGPAGGASALPKTS